MVSEEVIREALAKDPGDPRFFELAAILEKRASWNEAVEVCLAGLSRNPGAHKGRLLLARLYYSKGMVPFALREILELKKAFPDSRTLDKLIHKLGGGAAQGETESKQRQELSSSLKAQTTSDSILGEAAVVSSEANSKSSASTIAEVELDFDVLEMIENEENKK